MSLKNTDECVELKNIKYKSMMLNGMNNNMTNHETITSANISKLEQFLESEKTNNKVEQWAKLDIPAKIQRFLVYAEKYKIENNLTDDEKNKLIVFLKDCLLRKKLQKAKEIVYDKVTGEIKEILGLSINQTTNNFTIRNFSSKSVSTLKMLTPKKKTNTVKNILGSSSLLKEVIPIVHVEEEEIMVSSSI